MVDHSIITEPWSERNPLRALLGFPAGGGEGRSGQGSIEGFGGAEARALRRTVSGAHFHGADVELGVLFPGDMAFFGVLLTSAFLASLTAALISVLLANLYDKKTGLIAGLVYAGMVEPMALSLSGFTHDHVQLPVMLLCMLGTVMAVRSSGRIRAGYIFLALVLAYNGWHINDSILVGFGVIGIYIGYELVHYLAKKRYINQRPGSAYPLVH